MCHKYRVVFKLLRGSDRELKIDCYSLCISPSMKLEESECDLTTESFIEHSKKNSHKSLEIPRSHPSYFLYYRLIHWLQSK